MVKIYNALDTHSLNGEWTNVNSNDTITINYEERTCENSLTISKDENGSNVLIITWNVVDFFIEAQGDSEEKEEEDQAAECERNGHRDTGRGVCAECGEFLKE